MQKSPDSKLAKEIGEEHWITCYINKKENFIL